ncbi:MAG: HAMP domain-containing protein [Candidatus Paraimprobicoccus trichonymphae]|uniref:HAMP domain-containing protein n=1 Tax=Candidatus Paraimprobicoccus trichonymphae TaxID=3033793 RepID=A0AA48I2W9_9FIRM|nr:MAG: HAMP domain-containing protein [Candidatus Paraimprobicoccus trichonymphae]
MKFKIKLNKNFWYILIAIFGIVLGFFVQDYFNRPNIGTFINSDIDPAGNIYILSIDKDKEVYKISKINVSSKLEFQFDLDKSDEKSNFNYNEINVDSKGNFYISKQFRSKKEIFSEFPLIQESVLMYDTKGSLLKTIANIDFSNDPNPPIENYVKKIQIVDQNIIIIGFKEGVFDVVKVNPLENESPEKVKSFEVKPSIEISDKNVDFVNDISVLSDGRIFYSTLRGELFCLDLDDNFIDYSYLIPRDKFLLSGFSVDLDNSLYFTNNLVGNFYKLETNAELNLQSIYKMDENVIKNVKVQDIRRIYVVNPNEYFAVLKNFNNLSFLRFGSNDKLITNIHNKFYPLGIIIIALVFAICMALGYFIIFIIQKGFRRVVVTAKILGFFTPIFILIILALILIITKNHLDRYILDLREIQDAGAKIAAGNIDSKEFETVDPVKDYLSINHINLNSGVKNSYADLLNKIGEKSDYLITYIVESNKIYSSFNTRFSINSNSYKYLRYVNPDMFPKGLALVDMLLEEDETSNLYSIWSELKNPKNTSTKRAVFRDVHGDISASFCVIKNSNDVPIGFVGNFLDENVHKNMEFRKIFRDYSIYLLIVILAIIIYLYFVIKIALKALRRIEHGINRISVKEWNTRIKIVSKDELADVSNAFNLMSEKIDSYTENMSILNKEYLKYLPKRLIKLIGKDKITQIKLQDKKKVNVNILYLSFHFIKDKKYEFKSEDELFDAINSSYPKFLDIVKNNNGIVYSFDGLSMKILFEDVNDAFNCSLQFKEININKNLRKNMRMVLDYGEIILGISGNEDIRGIILVSEEVIQITDIDKNLRNIGVSHVATDNIINKLTTAKNFRYIGIVINISNKRSMKIYEIIEISNRYKNVLYIQTKKLFEEAVDFYLKKDFEQACKMFSTILGINEKDPVAIYYLVKCDKLINDKSGDSSENWSGELF